MTVGVATLLFFVLVVGLALLPLAPALREWRRPTDVAPLRVAQLSAVDARRFARGFEVYVETHLSAVLDAVRPGDDSVEGVLPDGTPYLVAGADGWPRLTAAESAGEDVQRVVVSAADLRLREGVRFRREAYARGSLEVGADATVRAAMADGDVTMRPRSRSLRWVHAAGTVVAEADCVLHGRVTAGESITLAVGAVFERLNAPRVRLGAGQAAASGPAPAPARTDLQVLEPDEVPNLVSTEVRWLVDGDLTVPADRLVPADVVATGGIRVGSGVRVAGGLKSHGDLELGRGVWVEGAAVAGGSLRVGTRSRVHGPALAEREVELRDGAVVGAPDRPTTVSAPRIRAGADVVCHGTVWARVEGRTVPAVPEEEDTGEGEVAA